MSIFYVLNLFFIVSSICSLKTVSGLKWYIIQVRPRTHQINFVCVTIFDVLNLFLQVSSSNYMFFVLVTIVGSSFLSSSKLNQVTSLVSSICFFLNRVSSDTSSFGWKIFLLLQFWSPQFVSQPGLKWYIIKVHLQSFGRIIFLFLQSDHSQSEPSLKWYFVNSCNWPN